MRVLHVISSLDTRHGGPGIALRGLACAQQRLSHQQVAVVATKDASEKQSVAKELVKCDVPVRVVGPCISPLMRHKDLVPTLVSQIATADVVHIHALWEEIQYQAARISRKANVPYIVRPCGMLDPWSLSQSSIKKRIYLKLRLRKMLNRASAIHFTTVRERDLVRNMKLRSRPIVEPNGVDFDEFYSLPPRGAFRRRHPSLNGRRIVLFLGRIHPKKGLELLIRAFSQLSLGDCALVIAGPDHNSYLRVLTGLTADLGIVDRVYFAGMQHGNERIESLNDAELFVLPSHQENFGIAVIESLAVGTPVLISDQVNIHEEISSAQVGTVHKMTASSLAEYLQRMLVDKRELERKAHRAREFALSRFDWQDISGRWNTHYKEIIKLSHSN